MFLLGVISIGVAVAVLCRDLPIGKQLRSLLIEAPARRLSKLTWAKTLVSVALLTFFVGVLLIGFNMHDGVVVFMMLPEVLAWIAAFDIATLLELSIVAVFAATSIRVDQAVKFMVAKVTTLFAPSQSRTREGRRERRAKPRRPARDARDEDASSPAWGYAFA